MHDGQLSTLAQCIREMWVAEYRDFELRTTGLATGWGRRHMVHWDGGNTPDGKVCKPVWPKIAKHVTENDLEPDLLVRALFYRKTDYPPTPNQAHGPYALEQYRLYTSPGTTLEIKSDLIHGFDSQKQRALSEVASKTTYFKLDETTAWKVTVGDTDVPLTPLFRYCVACNQGWDDIGTKFEAQAKKQYRRFAAVYNEVWGAWIPETLKKEAPCVQTK